MTFVLLLTGEGQGCDYCIDCNKTFRVFDAKGAAEAMAEVEEIIKEYGEPGIECFRLFVAGCELTDEARKYIDEKDARAAEEQKKAALAAQEARERAEYERLDRKFGKR
jgi:hypothetical protein